MLMRMIYDEDLAQAAYLIGCQKTGEAVLIDPQRDADRYLELASEHALTITAVAETHIHADFVSGAREIAQLTGCRVFVSAEGGDWRSNWLNSKHPSGSYDATELKHNDAFSIGNIQFRAIHTPGHTPEHLAYLVTDTAAADEPIALLSGDFIFVGDLGRPDLLESAAGYKDIAESSADQLADSANNTLQLPDHLQIWPAHGAGSSCGKALGAIPQSTLGYERRFNSALKLATDKPTFVNFILENQPEPPRYFAYMKQINRDGPPLLGELPKPEHTTIPNPASQIIDTRPWAEFKRAHIKGSLWSPLGKNFHSFAGSYADPETPITLVVTEDALDHAIRSAIRIGLDKITHYITPEDLAKATNLEQAAEIDTTQLKQAQPNNPFVLDVRRASEFNEARIPGTTHIPHTRLATRLDELPKDRDILVHCRSGVRSAAAASLLNRSGFKATNIAGGIRAWQANNYGTIS